MVLTKEALAKLPTYVTPVKTAVQDVLKNPNLRLRGKDVE
jgi:hypothetical protein